MDGFDDLIDVAERNGGRARSIAPQIPRSTRNHENTPAVRNRFNGDTQLSPSLLRGLGSQNAQTIDPLYELERANRLMKEAKEYKKNTEEVERRRRIARKQRCLKRSEIIPLAQQELDASFTCTLPGGIVGTAFYLSKITGLDPLGVAFCILGATSIATWGRVTVKLSEAWSEPAVDILLQASGSGTRKSSLVSHLRSPCNQFCSKANEGYEERIKKNNENVRLTKNAAGMRAKKILISAIEESSGQAQQDAIEILKEAIDEATEFNLKLSQGVTVHPPTQLLVDKGTPFQLAATLSEQGECQGCITAEGNMIASKMVSSPEAANLFLQGHTQEPYVYENSKMRIELAHPALPMVNLVQPIVASNFYSNETLNKTGVTARFVPYFYKDATPDLQVSSTGVPIEAYDVKIIQLLQLFHTQDRNAPRYQVGVTPEALTLIHSFEEEVRNEVISSMPEAAEPWLRKAHGQAVRFAWDIHAWNSDQPHLCSITEEEMRQGIDLVRANFPHVKYAYDPCGLVAYSVAQKILESLYRITDRWEQDKLIDDGIDSTTIQQRIGVKSKEVNNALQLLDRHNYLVVYDDASNNLKIALHPYFYDWR